VENQAVWLTKQEVATIARVSVRTVERAIASGKLRSTKAGGSVRIHRRWVSTWLALVLALLLVLLLIGSPHLSCATKRALGKSHHRHHREHVKSREALPLMSPLLLDVPVH